jgi:hypothetical protein
LRSLSVIVLATTGPLRYTRHLYATFTFLGRLKRYAP